jgi:hypothetical protein
MASWLHSTHTVGTEPCLCSSSQKRHSKLTQVDTAAAATAEAVTRYS